MAGFTVSRQEIERTIEEFIRLRLVAMGYLADVALYQPSNAANIAAFTAANAAIVTSGKQVIEIFGVSSNERRGEKRVNKMWLNFRQSNPGSVSMFGESVDPNAGIPGTFKRTAFTTSTSNLLYDIRTCCDKVEYDRICYQAIIQGLTASRVGQALNVVLADYTLDSTRYILIRQVNVTDIRQPQFLERLYTYEVIDVYTDAWGYAPYITGIPPISEVQTDVILEDEDPTTLLIVN